MPKKLATLPGKKEQKAGAQCCHSPAPCLTTGLKKIALVGNPNVGKSVMFNNLTGIYAHVSNYPGTTVEVLRGKGRLGGEDYEIIDTPGMYSLYPLSEEERVARDILLYEELALILHIVDARNLDRMLSFTLQLIEAGLPVVLVLNMMDELEKSGLIIDVPKLEVELKIPVVPTSGLQKKGLAELKETIVTFLAGSGSGVPIPAAPLFAYHHNDDSTRSLEPVLEEIGCLLTGSCSLSPRALGLLLLQEEPAIEEYLSAGTGADVNSIKEMVGRQRGQWEIPLEYAINLRRQQVASRLARSVQRTSKKSRLSLQEFLSKLTMHPLTGIPILALVLYFGLYKLVGEFGAGVIVDFLEGTVFEQYINPFLVNLFKTIIPAGSVIGESVRSLFVGEYGLFTLGLRYALGIIFPIVTVFFFVFAIIEDSGYLPRLAMLIDSLFKRIGLSGRAVIPMVLGLGCDTMATLVTRTLPTKRERVISTLLLALAIPCSAQLGVILALLGPSPLGMLLWLGVLSLVFLATGFLTSKLLPGEKPVFYMEIPPLRFPSPSNVLVKTVSRVEWYLKEIIPLFLLGSVIIWLGQITGGFDLIIRALQYPLQLIGMPGEAAPVFLLGFFRRDYGAAGLYDLQQQGLLSGNQVAVAAIALTLFLPCIAQFMIIIKERGIKAGLYMSATVFIIAYAVAFIVNFLLNTLGVIL